MRNDSSTVRTFVVATLPWVIGASVLWLATGIVVSRSWGNILVGALPIVGLVVTFSAFAGGTAVSATVRSRRDFLTMVMIAAVYGSITWAGLAYVKPAVEYGTFSHDLAEQRYPFGPETPRVLAELRDYVAETPVDAVVFGSTTVLESAPAYFEKAIQFPRVLFVLAVLLASLGYSVGIVTMHAPIGVRHRLRWFVGIVYVLVFIWLDDAAREYLRHNLSVSGTGISWLALTAHIVSLAILAPFVYRKLRA